MTAKALLERIITLRKAIDYRKTKVRALTGLPHRPSSATSAVENAVCSADILEREIAELDLERKSLIAKIDLLEDADLSRLLTLRYVQESRWDDIMAELGYSESHIFRLHRQALIMLNGARKNESK